MTLDHDVMVSHIYQVSNGKLTQFQKFGYANKTRMANQFRG